MRVAALFLALSCSGAEQAPVDSRPRDDGEQVAEDISDESAYGQLVAKPLDVHVHDASDEDTASNEMQKAHEGVQEAEDKIDVLIERIKLEHPEHTKQVLEQRRKKRQTRDSGP